MSLCVVSEWRAIEGHHVTELTICNDFRIIQYYCYAIFLIYYVIYIYVCVLVYI
jgi:hypothetical protein